MEKAATTASNLEAEHDSGTINMTQFIATINELIPQGTGLGSGTRRQDTILGDITAQTRFERLSKQSNEPPLSRVNTLGSGDDSMKLQELIELCIKLSERVLTLENIKIAQDLEITNLKKREDASNQGRNIAEIDQDEGISWFQEDAETQGRYGHDIGISTVGVTTDSVPVTTASSTRPLDDSITDDITLA
ncbi:hypothetical protein Tco_1498880, partial [Tanacetum coccineum]